MVKAKTPKKNNLLVSLQDPAAVEELIDLYINFLLNQPLNSIFTSADLSATIVAGLKGAASDPKNEQWMIDLIETGLKKAKKQKHKGKMKDLVSPDTIEACQQLAQLPISISKESAAALIDHPLAKTFLREILTQSILDFSQQFASHLPGGKVMSGLMGMARDIASSKLSSAGFDIEQKAKSFVEQALSPSLKVVADLLADNNHATGLADWRAHILSVVVNMTKQEFVTVFAKVDEKNLATQLSTLFKSIALWDRLEPTIKSYLDETMKQVGSRSVRRLIAGTSLEKEWRGLISHQFSSVLLAFFAHREFADWLGKYG
jgi:hypothetical protein